MSDHLGCFDCMRLRDQLTTSHYELVHYRGLWEDSCKAVAELCLLAGAAEDEMHDLWNLHGHIERRMRNWKACVARIAELDKQLAVAVDALEKVAPEHPLVAALDEFIEAPWGGQ